MSRRKATGPAQGRVAGPITGEGDAIEMSPPIYHTNEGVSIPLADQYLAEMKSAIGDAPRFLDAFNAFLGAILAEDSADG